MTSDVIEIEKRKLRELTRAEQAELANFLLEELDGPPDPDIEQVWLTESKRRYDEFLAGKTKGIPAEQVLARMDAIRTKK